MLQNWVRRTDIRAQAAHEAIRRARVSSPAFLVGIARCALCDGPPVPRTVSAMGLQVNQVGNARISAAAPSRNVFQWVACSMKKHEGEQAPRECNKAYH
jgi:hypothetical protein